MRIFKFNDLSLYSKKEVIASWVMLGSWVLLVVTIIINVCINLDYIKSISSGKVVAEPWCWNRLYRLAFVFLISAITCIILKFRWKRQRAKGKLLSYYDSIEQGKLETKSKYYSPVYITICSVVSALGLALVMFCVWY